jgi:hypothetical protein
LAEASEGHEYFPVFVERARAHLGAAGVDATTLASEESRILERLRMPDGSAFDGESGWASLAAAVDAFEEHCAAGRVEEACAALEAGRESWRAAHDRWCDWVYGLVDAAARLLGEEAVGGLWEDLLAGFAASRDRFDVRVRPWAESQEMLELDTLETFRGHMSGPGRLGDLEVTEESDRVVFRFAPCGSGGRTYQDDPEGGPPRMEPPYNYAVTTDQHDWAWNTRGVCLYCAHCCFMQELIPIRRIGYPIRVVDPPVWPEARGGGRCTWTVYRDPSLVPPEAFRRVGMRRPSADAVPGAGS